MTPTHRATLKEIMTTAWQFVKRNGLNMSEALRRAWANVRLRARLMTGIVCFRFEKVDGSIRQAFGTLKSSLLPPTQGGDRRRSDAVQVYFDTEKGEYRCFKKVNLLY